MGRTDGGKGWGLVRACPKCGWPATDCRCSRPATPAAAGPAVFRLRMERRRGKPVTVAAAEGLADTEARSLLQDLRRRLATGGTFKDGVLELQGEHRDRLRGLLQERGYRVKG